MPIADSDLPFLQHNYGAHLHPYPLLQTLLSHRLLGIEQVQPLLFLGQIRCRQWNRHFQAAQCQDLSALSGNTRRGEPVRFLRGHRMMLVTIQGRPVITLYFQIHRQTPGCLSHRQLLRLQSRQAHDGPLSHCCPSHYRVSRARDNANTVAGLPRLKFVASQAIRMSQASFRISPFPLHICTVLWAHLVLLSSEFCCLFLHYRLHTKLSVRIPHYAACTVCL